MISSHDLEDKIAELLDNFYKRRITRISELKLEDTLKKKNPYLFRAIGVENANDIIEQLLTAYMNSSDEGIFGDAFFEPLAKYASGGGVSPTEGVDVTIETAFKYTAIAVKSGTSVFNSDSKKKQIQNFETLGARLRKLQKQFDPLIGYCYGKKRSRAKKNFRELAGQEFWQEITGDPDFYLKIIQLMKDKPKQHLPKFKAAWDMAINKFTGQFIQMFCDPDGKINWSKLTEFNSGRKN